MGRPRKHKSSPSSSSGTRSDQKSHYQHESFDEQFPSEFSDLKEFSAIETEQMEESLESLRQLFAPFQEELEQIRKDPAHKELMREMRAFRREMKEASEEFRSVLEGFQEELGPAFEEGESAWGLLVEVLHTLGPSKQSTSLLNAAGDYTLTQMMQGIEQGDFRIFFLIVALYPGILRHEPVWEPTGGKWTQASELVENKEARQNLKRLIHAIETQGSGRPQDPEKAGKTANNKAAARANAVRRLMRKHEEWQERHSLTSIEAAQRVIVNFKETTKIEDESQVHLIIQRFCERVKER